MQPKATRFLFNWLMLISFLFCLPTGLAGIHVLPQYLEFSNTNLRNDFTVFNDDKKSMAYVNITILKHNSALDVAGTTDKDKQNLPAFIPVTHTTEAGLVVTPPKLVIAPGASRLVRIQLTKTPEYTEKMYEILVNPVESDLIIKNNKQDNKVQAGIRLVVSYGILAAVAPTHIQAKLALDRQGDKIIAINSGNVSILLSDGQQCVANKCEKLSVYRVYPDTKIVFKAPTAAPVTFTQKYVGGGSTPIQSN